MKKVFYIFLLFQLQLCLYGLESKSIFGDQYTQIIKKTDEYKTMLQEIEEYGQLCNYLLRIDYLYKNCSSTFENKTAIYTDDRLNEKLRIDIYDSDESLKGTYGLPVNSRIFYYKNETVLFSAYLLRNEDSDLLLSIKDVQKNKIIKYLVLKNEKKIQKEEISFHNKFYDLEYGLTQEKVVQQCGVPTKIESDYMDVFYYDFDDYKIVINFFTDDSLSCVYQMDNNGDISIIKEFCHSFFTNSNFCGKFTKSGKAAEDFLLSNNFVQLYFYNNMMLKEIELSKKDNENFKIEKVEYFTELDDRIVYTWYSLNGEESHCIFAHILSDEPLTEREILACQIGFVKYDKNHDGLIEDDEGDWFNNCYELIK